jgi:hypothetical protein
VWVFGLDLGQELFGAVVAYQPDERVQLSAPEQIAPAAVAF